MKQDYNDRFDWTRTHGLTPSKLTGPDSAYSGGFYIFIETSDPRVPGDNAM